MFSIIIYTISLIVNTALIIVLTINIRIDKKNNRWPFSIKSNNVNN